VAESPPEGAARSLMGLVELVPAAPDRFTVSRLPATPNGVLGSGLLAAAVLASGATISGELRAVSLHAAFLRAGRPGGPVELTVARLHDGRTLAGRQVTVTQAGRRLVDVVVRFHRPAVEGRSWQPSRQPPPPAPSAGRPEEAVPSTMTLLDGFEIRGAGRSGPDGRPVLHPYWVRARHPLGDDPAVHAALVAFLSDIGVSGSALAPDTPMGRRLRAVSLDHSLWWHRPCRVDEWLLIDAAPLTNAGGRGLARGEVWNESGELVASLAQEVLAQRPHPAAAT